MNIQQREEQHGFQEMTVHAVAMETRSAYEKYQTMEKFTGSQIYFKASMIALDSLIDLNQLEMEHLDADSVLFDRTCEGQNELSAAEGQQKRKLVLTEVEDLYVQRDALEKSSFLKAVAMHNHFQRKIQVLLHQSKTGTSVDDL